MLKPITRITDVEVLLTPNGRFKVRGILHFKDEKRAWSADAGPATGIKYIGPDEFKPDDYSDELLE